MISENFSPTILRFDSLDSTNIKGRELARTGGAEGTVIVANTQTQGRGRGKREWYSPEGGLYTSVLLYPKEGRRPTDLPILAGLAAAQAIKTILPKTVDVTVKWPNDVLLGWKKTAGILCESLGEEFHHICVVGIGINVNIPESELAPYQDNPFSATSLMVESAGGRYVVEDVLRMVLTKLFALYRLYHTDGFQNIHYLWHKNCDFIGKKIELSDSGADGNARVTGTFLGIDDSGALMVSNARGEHHTYYAGEITCFWP